MSYAPVQSLGFVWFPIAEGGTCNGGLFDDDDDCCPKDTWENSAYVQAKGQTSLQYYNERRLIGALNTLLSPIGIYQSRLEADAHDQYAVVQPSFVQGLRIARKFFLESFPQSRWYWNKDARRHECASDGLYSIWSAHAVPVTEKRVKLLSALVGETLTAAQLKTWESSPAKYREWATAAVGVINRMTGSGWKGPPQLGKLYKVTGGNECRKPGATPCKLVPSELAIDFMALFMPRLNIGKAGQAARDLALRKAITQPSVIRKAAEAARRKKTTIRRSAAFRFGSRVRLTGNVSDTDEQPTLGASPALIGTAVVVAGFASFVALRKLSKG